MAQVRKEVVGTLLPGNVKTVLFSNIKLSFVFKISGLNGYLKGYLKSRINKLPKKININVLLTNADLLKISVLYLF